MTRPTTKTRRTPTVTTFYEVTIRVVDGDGLSGEKSVRVTVMNVNEDGKLTLSPEQPDDGMPVVATITDPDSPAEYGGVVVTNWEWATTTSSTATEFPREITEITLSQEPACPNTRAMWAISCGPE